MKKFIIVSSGHFLPDYGLTEDGKEKMRRVNNYLLRIIPPEDQVFVLSVNTLLARQNREIAMQNILHSFSLSTWYDIDPGASPDSIKRGGEEILFLVEDYDCIDVVIVFTNVDGARLFPRIFRDRFLSELKHFPVTMEIYGGVMVFDLEKRTIESPVLE